MIRGSTWTDQTNCTTTRRTNTRVGITTSLLSLEDRFIATVIAIRVAGAYSSGSRSVKPVKISKITDGTSKTLMIGEDVVAFNIRHSAAFFSNGSVCSCNAPLNHGLNQNPEIFAIQIWYEAQGFRSRHPGGVQFCLADGSVRFIPENIDNVFFRTSCTRNGNESVPGEL